MTNQDPLATWREKLEFYQGLEAIESDPAKKFQLKKELEEIEAKIADLSQPPTPAAQSTAAPKTSIAHLPTGADHFVGREAELAQLDAAWDDPNTNVLSLVAFGGVGKSALVYQWLQAMGRDKWRGATHVLGHSFYSQGAREDANASADPFLEMALRFFDDPDPTAGSAWEKGTRLAQQMQRTNALLVLDGLEPLQFGPTSGDPGRLKDQGVQALLRELTYSNSGLCLITTRIHVADLPNAPAIDLEHLSPAAGAALLHALGVKGTTAELEAASIDAQGHGLALTLLGTYLRKAHNGDVRKIGEIELATADERQGSRAFRMMETYERWLESEDPNSIELAILRLMGLFDRPAEADCIAALRQPPAIDGLTTPLMDITDANWNYAISNLQEYGLLSRSQVTPSPTHLVTSSSLDCHPLIREYFATQLATEHADAYRAAHRRLYEHLAETADDLPETLDAMMPLYHAIAHGCKAGLVQETHDEIHFKRVRRRNDYFSTRQLGAFGSDLGALANFFEQPWSRPSPQLSKDRQAVLLNQAAVRLRALSRLTEAVEPMQAAVDNEIRQQNWEHAAINASNVSELSLTLGQVGRAVHAAAQSVELADRSGDAFQRMCNRTNLGDAQHQAGLLAESGVAFGEAEVIQAERQPGYPLLYSLQGFLYCEVLLGGAGLQSPITTFEDKGGRFAGGQVGRFAGGQVDIEGAVEVCRAVRERAETTLGWAMENRASVLGIALDRLTLGRTWLLEAQLSEAGLTDGAWRQAQEALGQSVDLLRRASDQEMIARGLLAWAELGRAQAVAVGDSADRASQRADFITQAERALDEVDLIAGRGQMLLHQVDAAIERAKLALVQGDPVAAGAYLAQARKLVKRTEAPFEPYESQWDEWDPPEYVFAIEPGQVVGYHKRNGEMDVLEKLIGG